MLTNDANAKAVLFAFSAGAGLSDHVAALLAIIQFIKDEATLMIDEVLVAGPPGTWIQIAAKTPHRVKTQSPVVRLLT